MTQKHKPTEEKRKLATDLAIVGIQQSVIAGMLDVTEKTLRLHYRCELDEGLARANAVIGAALFDKARNGDTASMIFWMKTRAGWRETNRLEVDDKTKKPRIIELIAVRPDADKGDTSPL